MKRIALDTDAINRLVDFPTWQNVAATARRCGIAFVIVHVVRDQLARTSDVDRRAALLAVCEALPRIEPPTSGFVLDTSRLDSAEMQESAKVAAVTTTGRGKIQDALIGATAMVKADVLVTDDIDRTSRVKAQTAPCEVWTFEQFVRFLCDA